MPWSGKRKAVSTAPARPPLGVWQESELASFDVEIKANPAELREAIAEALWDRVSFHGLAHTCDALGMPPGPEGGDPWRSKRRAVRNRLIALRSSELLDR